MSHTVAFLFPDGMLYVILRLGAGLELRACFARLLPALPVGRGAWGLGEAGDLPLAAPGCPHPPAVLLRGLCTQAIARNSLISRHGERVQAFHLLGFGFFFFPVIEDQFTRADIPAWMPLLPAARGHSGSCRCGDIQTPSPEFPPPPRTELSFVALPGLAGNPGFGRNGAFL